MNQRQRTLMDCFLAQVNECYRPMFLDLAEYAAGLGYGPVRCRTKDMSIDFRNRRVGRAIMKMEVAEQRHDGFRCGERRIPGLRLKFFASSDYSEIFHKGVQRVIEDYDGRYTGCYGCGRCPDVPQGYVFRYPDGRTVFRCGAELISIFDFGEEHVEEIKGLLKRQADYFAEILLSGR